MAMWNVFSKRNKALPDVLTYDKLPKKFRNQVLHILCDGLPSVGHSPLAPLTIREMCSRDLAKILCRLHGYFPHLNMWSQHNEHFRALAEFIVEHQNVEQVLDAIELAFRMMVNMGKHPDYRHLIQNAPELVAELNDCFRENGLGYSFEDGDLVCVSNSALHQEAVRPALHVLSDPSYAGPNEELHQAFKHHREGDMKACLNECLKAFESTMKVICDTRGWAYEKDRATAAQLISAILQPGRLLASHYDSQLNSLQALLKSGIPTTRNRLGGHGQGGDPKEAPEFVARYMLHLTCSTVLMLVDSEKALP